MEFLKSFRNGGPGPGGSGQQLLGIPPSFRFDQVGNLVKATSVPHCKSKLFKGFSARPPNSYRIDWKIKHGMQLDEMTYDRAQEGRFHWSKMQQIAGNEEQSLNER